jgi:seryl-tRNA synthetase
VGEPRAFEAEGFAPRDHVTLAEALDLVDFAAGAEVGEIYNKKITIQ